MYICFLFKQKTAYEMRISDWSSDVCSSDLGGRAPRDTAVRTNLPQPSSQQLLIYFAYEVWGRTWRGPRPSESATPPRRAQRYWQQPASDSFGKVTTASACATSPAARASTSAWWAGISAGRRGVSAGGGGTARGP